MAEKKAKKQKSGLDFQINPLWDFLEKTLGTKMAVNLFAPYRGAGIKVESINENFTSIQVAMKMGVMNANYVGTHFGGSLYSMCDPFYMFILLKHLGEKYIVWDKSAGIEFLRPADGTVRAVFEIAEEELEEIRQVVARQKKTDWEFQTSITDEQGREVARVKKILYIRRRPGS